MISFHPLESILEMFGFTAVIRPVSVADKVKVTNLALDLTLSKEVFEKVFKILLKSNTVQETLHDTGIGQGGGKTEPWTMVDNIFCVVSFIGIYFIVHWNVFLC